MRNNQQQSTATTTTSYAWYGGAVQSRVSYAQSGQSVKTSDYSYNSQGTLRSVRIEDGRPRTITFDVDQGDQIVRRREADNNYAKGDPFELYYRFGGKQLGYSGNNGTLDVSDEASIRARTASPGTGAFRGGADYGGSYADFDQSGVEAINSYAQGSSGGVYTARAGDTLAGVALQLWGDASLWYKLAAANGLSASSSLSEGQALRLPSGVQRSSFTAATLNPYDPASAVGDTSPTAPSPAPKKNKCGIFGAILLAVVAVGIAIWAGPGAIAFFSNTLGFGAVAGAVAGGAAAAALGSVVSQGVGLATGIQDKFSWGDVALAALGGGIGGGLKAIGDVGKGLGKVGKFLGKGNFVSGAARGVVASSLTQGIGVATGLQAKFSWAGVAAAGLGGGISAKLGGHPLHPGHARPRRTLHHPNLHPGLRAQAQGHPYRHASRQADHRAGEDRSGRALQRSRCPHRRPRCRSRGGRLKPTLFMDVQDMPCGVRCMTALRKRSALSAPRAAPANPPMSVKGPNRARG